MSITKYIQKIIDIYLHLASWSETPEVWVLESLSEPAKSTKFNFE